MIATSPLRIALLGCGRAAEMHSRTLRRFPGVHLYFASREERKAADFNTRFHGSGHFGSYDAALTSSEIDVALIVTPPHLHLELTEQALRSGKHVIVEKPPFLRSSDFSAVEALARSASRQVMVAENYFYKPLLQSLRAVVTSGELGTLQFVRVSALKTQRTGNWRDEIAVAGGGALYEGGIHWVSFMANMGLTVQSVSAHRPGRQNGPDRSMLLVFQYAEGAIGTLHFSWETPSALGGIRLSRIHGSRGSVAFESNGVFLMRFGARRGLSFPGLRDLAGYHAMFTDFIDALRANRPARYTLQHARRDLEFVEAAYASATSTSPAELLTSAR
ncbi:MAG TPA: Gfo/Idh/MocA family oxidoreductase [Gemmatimonadaceae bacterium]|nr:Gfo/Idh/MocA family oxidoreductase [Gemmatimonadaceae bacterium]